MRSISPTQFLPAALLVLLAALSVAWPAPARAQPLGRTIVVALGLGEEVRGALPAADALEASLTERRVSVVSMHDARDRFTARSRPPLVASNSDLDVLAREARQAIEHVAFGRTAAAQRSVREVMMRAERTLESLNRETARARQLLDACLALVRSELHDNRRDRALEQAMACRRLVPDLAPSEVAHPANVVGVLAEADDLLRRMRVGKLTLTSQPDPNCSVFLNGRHLGSTPFVLDRAAAGEYRVQVECGGELPGRVHVVQLGDAPVTLLVDAGFDQAVSSDPRLTLRYADEAGLRGAVAAHAAQLGRETRVEDVVLVRADRARAQLLRVRVDQGRLVARIYLDLDRAGGLDAEQLARGLNALSEGRLDPLPPLPAAAPVSAQLPPPVVASAPPAPTPAAPAAEPLPPRRRRAGLVLAGLAGGLLATGLALELSAQGLRDGLPLAGDEGFSAGKHTRADHLEAASWLGVSAGPVGLAAVLLATAQRAHVPWWSYLAGAAGVALAGVGVAELVRANDCQLHGDEGGCLRTRDTSARGAMLLSGAAPLIALPFTQLVRRPAARALAGLSLRAGAAGAVLMLRGDL